MSDNITRMISRDFSQTERKTGFFVGQIIDITQEGKVIVDYAGNKLNPMSARLLQGGISELEDLNSDNKFVLLVFERDDPSLPIIIGSLGDSVTPSSFQKEYIIPLNQPKEGVFDGKRIAINATEEIVLTCGKSSITLNKDGKVIVRGKKLLSRASESNKIKGSSVSLN